MFGVRVSAVIPALNEARNLPHVLPRIPKGVEEVILVDGLSSDGTIDVARGLRPDIKIVHETKRGKGNALRAGFAEANGDVIVMLDADGSTDPAEIPIYVGALLAGADFVKGSRFLQGGGSADLTLLRRMGNHGFVQTVRALFGGKFSDVCYGYNAFWKWVLPFLDLDGEGFEIETMMNVRALRAGLKVVEVPSFEYPRRFGESQLRALPDGWRVLKTLAREYLRPAGGSQVAGESQSGVLPKGWSMVEATARNHPPLLEETAAGTEPAAQAERRGVQIGSVVELADPDRRRAA